MRVLNIMGSQEKEGSIWAFPILCYTHSLQAFILTSPHTVLIQDNNDSHIVESRSCLSPHLAQYVSDISHSCSFPPIERLSSLGSWEATLASFPVSWSLLLSLLC